MGMTNDGLSYWQAESEGIDLLDVTIGDLLDRRADELPDQEAIVYSCYPEFGDALNIRWTYQDYRERANAVAFAHTIFPKHSGRAETHDTQSASAKRLAQTGRRRAPVYLRSS